MQTSSGDVDSIDWPVALAGPSAERERALGVLHAMLLRVAHADARRRSYQLELAGPELDDIAQQAADDALVAICAKLGQFRGESRFSTWAYKFAVLEVGIKINRHHWQRSSIAYDEAHWERVPDRFGITPEQHAEARELLDGVRLAVETQLTVRQRDVFLAIVVTGVPVDVLAAELGSNRNAIYKVMFDARRKIRDARAADGLVPDTSTAAPGTRIAMTAWAALDRLLTTDPRDRGCEQAIELLHVYAELVATDPDAARRHHADVAAHLESCGPCAEDLAGLLHAMSG